ncbi:copper chaperone PCu(A)C [Thalassotalea castellviae]|uniref:Copper chaperone PCu(A)C n=1 Tax=Thalassotalea castellviae TaxID=3075612 RepID=A0ABU3A437_9GAMM|nr:copper chaperone PCu(A)C [Thalassotalea sp. W431]MDT0604942.1 copper chaperone PCu(A)C [Thalassotalea sp. W431]
MKKLTDQIKQSVPLLALLAGLIVNIQAFAETVVVEHGYIRATIPGTTVSSAYMEIKNTSKQDIVLIGATSKVSDRIEIHEHVMNDEMMRMQQRESLTIAANDSVVLQPSGYHLMIFNLAEPLKVDANVELTLQFSDKKTVNILLPVQSIKRKKQKESAHHHHH